MQAAFALKEEQLWGETQFEDPAHYAVPSAGVTWGSLLKEIKEKANEEPDKFHCLAHRRGCYRLVCQPDG